MDTNGGRRHEWQPIARNSRDSASEDGFPLTETAPAACPAPAAGHAVEEDAPPMYQTMPPPTNAAEELRRETKKLGLLLARMDNMTITGTVTKYECSKCQATHVKMHELKIGVIYAVVIFVVIISMIVITITALKWLWGKWCEIFEKPYMRSAKHHSLRIKFTH